MIADRYLQLTEAREATLSNNWNTGQRLYSDPKRFLLLCSEFNISVTSRQIRQNTMTCLHGASPFGPSRRECLHTQEFRRLFTRSLVSGALLPRSTSER